MIKQIIMSMYGTMLPMSRESVARAGLMDFLDKHEDKEIVVCSRLPKDVTLEDLENVGLAEKVRVYGAKDMRLFFDSEMIDDKYKTTIKDEAKYAGECVSSDSDRKPEVYGMAPPLRAIAHESGILLRDSVMISNDWVDIDDGMIERMGRVFEVPVFESAKEDTFSFDKINFYSARSLLSVLDKKMGVKYEVKLG